MPSVENICAASAMPHETPAHSAARSLFRSFVIGTIGFLTLIDLFGTQAILPTLTEHYGVAPGTMGVAVNASTLGMAISGLIVALFSRRLDRRNGIWISLTLLAVPTLLLAGAPEIASFATLRIVQGLFMAAAFTFTMTYLAEQCSADAAAGALAAYVTGVVASNLVGRLAASSIAQSFGIATNFQVFALLNLAGATLVFVALKKTSPLPASEPQAQTGFAGARAHLRNASLRRCFGVGFLILFAFIGIFSYVNFVLARAPFGLSPMALGLVYLVFLPAMLTTPMTGHLVRRWGARPAFFVAFAIALAGLPLLLTSALTPVLLGLILAGVGTFMAQAAATGFVGRAATRNRAAASGLYLSSYYFGGLIGAALVGQVFDRAGWPASVAVIALSLVLAACLCAGLEAPSSGTVHETAAGQSASLDGAWIARSDA